MRSRYHVLAFVLGFSLTQAACSDDAGTTTASGGTAGAGGGGATAGAGGTGGGGGAEPCVAPFLTKGPWTLAIDATSAKIRWEACDASAEPGVVFAKEGGGAEESAPSTSTSMTLLETHVAALNPNAAPDAAGTYHLHEAALTGLEQGSCYTYKLVADASRKGRFCTARPSGDAFTFMAIGDTNPGLGHTKGVLESALPEAPEMTIHGGDIQYYDSGLETWASWFPVMQPMLSAGAFFPAIGNHESEKSEELAEYALRFFGGAGFDGGETFYRFETGGVHFFSLNTEESIGQGSAQATWLEAELAEAKATPGFRFSVVFFHRPLVTCGDTGDDPAARAHLEPIFLANGVTLVLQAHMHGYERFELGELTYVTTAGGGGLMGDVDGNVSREYCGQRAAAAAAHHAVIFRVEAGQLVGTAIDEGGAVIDELTKVLP